jgi:hypothetical protein
MKHLITGGCSFSFTGGGDTSNWPGYITRYLKSKNLDFTYKHTGYPSQGQEMIQKKVMLEITESLERGIKPEDMQVIVMWSGTHRKSWWIDNPDIVDQIVKTMASFSGGMCSEFLDLRDNIPKENMAYFKTANGTRFQYNTHGGWYFTVDGSESRMEFITEFYMLDQHPGGIGKANISLENIIMLQNFCKLHNVKLIQQFFMDTVFQDIEQYKDHLNMNYLYKQLDFDNIIKEGMFEYLHQFLPITREKARVTSHVDRRAIDNGRDYFQLDGFHPGEVGCAVWCDNVLIPFLESKQ